LHYSLCCSRIPASLLWKKAHVFLHYLCLFMGYLVISVAYKIFYISCFHGDYSKVLLCTSMAICPHVPGWGGTTGPGRKEEDAVSTRPVSLEAWLLSFIYLSII
jgi:hypothetical protein